MADVKPGWKTLEGQAGVGGAITALIVSAMVAYFGVSIEQATTIAVGLVTAGALIYKVIEARRSVKVEASKTEATKAMAACANPAPFVSPPTPPASPYISSLTATPEPDPYGREGDPIDGP